MSWEACIGENEAEPAEEAEGTPTPFGILGRPDPEVSQAAIHKTTMRTPTDDFTPIEARCVGTAKLLHLFQYHFARRLFRAGTLEDAALILEQGWAPQFFNPPVPANAAAGSLIASPEAKKEP